MYVLSIVGFYIATLAFGLVILSLWLRIAMRFLKISSLSPLNRLILTVTNPIVSPVNSLISISKGSRYDWAAFIVLLLVEFLKICCLSLIAFHMLIPFIYIVIYTAADLIIQACDILFYAILIRVIMSYVNPEWNHPVADFLRALTEPLFVFGRRIVPDISGFDFSPFVMMICLKIITFFILSTLPWRLI